MALINLEAYHQRIRKYFNSMVKHRQFLEEGWVLRGATCNIKDLNAGKLKAKWEGLYLAITTWGTGRIDYEVQLRMR